MTFGLDKKKLVRTKKYTGYYGLDILHLATQQILRVIPTLPHTPSSFGLIAHSLIYL
jgi:hypothetical protein